jgi:hypothetical protein
MTTPKGKKMTDADKDVLLDKIELTKRNLLDLQIKLLEEIDNLETIHLELATSDIHSRTKP